MHWYRVTIVSLVFCSAVVNVANSLPYSDLEALGKACGRQHLCETNEISTTSKDCACDSACVTYQDCCIDAQRQPESQPVSPGNITCLNLGHSDRGIFVVSSCSSNWNGPSEIKQNCEGIPNFSDPFNAAPVISTFDGLTYKNRYCAECNNAVVESLKEFHSNLSCKGAEDLTEEMKMNQLSYNQQTRSWGIYRVDDEGNSNFVECQLRFYLPIDLKNYIHFCQVKMVSECARGWPGLEDEKLCKEYMAVVYDEDHVYRNPHCAICNNKTVSELRCKSRSRRDTPNIRRGTPFSLLLGLEKGNEQQKCPLDHIFDPYRKICRRMNCVTPGYVLRMGKCVPR